MNLWIADIDGVFTDFLAKPNSKAILLSTQLGMKCPFSYITGRSVGWLQGNFLSILSVAFERFKPSHAIIGAEYGGVLFHFENGRWVEKHKTESPISAELRQEIQTAIEKIPGVFFDSSKEIMISVEAEHSMREEQHEIVEKGLADAELILKKAAVSSAQLEYQRTTYACDLVPRGLNKEYGARLVKRAIGFQPSHVHLLGDAPSDLLLVHAVRDLPYTMHYVGDQSKLTDEQRERYVLEFSRQKYDLGTIETLRAAVDE